MGDDPDPVPDPAQRRAAGRCRWPSSRPGRSCSRHQRPPRSSGSTASCARRPAGSSSALAGAGDCRRRRPRVRVRARRCCTSGGTIDSGWWRPQGAPRGSNADGCSSRSTAACRRSGRGPSGQPGCVVPPPRRSPATGARRTMGKAPSRSSPRHTGPRPRTPLGKLRPAGTLRFSWRIVQASRRWSTTSSRTS